MLELLSVHVEKPPAEAHWQMGRIEASHRSWRYMAERTVDRMQTSGNEISTLCVIVNNAKNSRVRQCGSSAFQWTFGKNPKVPDSLLSVEGNLATHSGIDADEELRRRVQTRARDNAETARVEWDTSEALRRSILRAPRPLSENIEPGEKIAYSGERRSTAAVCASRPGTWSPRPSDRTTVATTLTTRTCGSQIPTTRSSSPI